jgi:hypothetical protein
METMANPNPKNKFQKGHGRVVGAGRPAGATNVLSRDIKTIIRKAAEEVGFIRRVPVFDAEGKPTGQTEIKYGEGGELGYMKWLAEHHPGPYAMLYGKLIPLEVDAKIEEKPVVRYETVEERWRMGDREGRDLGYLWFTWVTHWTPPIYAQVHPK